MLNYCRNNYCRNKKNDNYCRNKNLKVKVMIGELAFKRETFLKLLGYLSFINKAALVSKLTIFS